MNRSLLTTASGIGLLIASGLLPASPGPPRLFGDVCLRWEWVEDGRFPIAGHALTAAARGGGEFPLTARLRLLVEGEGVAALAGRHDDGRGIRAARPRIPDPPNAELNRLMLAADLAPGWSLALGRQYVTDSRQRYFGRSGWRQSRQSFDALVIAGEWSPAIAFEIAYLDRVWRSVGRFHPDPRERSQRLDGLLATARLRLPAGTLEGFVHELNSDSPSLRSHHNQGLRWQGQSEWSSFGTGLLLEVARQRQPGGARWLPYRAGELALGSPDLRLVLGFEYEGGDGETAFQTPLGSGHSFNGWADRFSTTPQDGLLDRYLAITGTHALGAGGTWIVRRHLFRATRGGERFGSEWNAELTFARTFAGLLRLKLADHRGRSAGEDLAKLWLSWEFEADGRR